MDFIKGGKILNINKVAHLRKNMGLIQDKFAEWKNKKANDKFERENFNRDKRIEFEYERKKLSHWEREFMRHKEEQRQKWLKEQVKRTRKQEQRKFWSGKDKNQLYAPNVFLKHKKLFSSGNMFANQKNFFNGHQDYFKNHKKLFAVGGKR